MNNAVFARKTMEVVRKHRDIKLVTTEARRNYLVAEPNYHTTKLFSQNLLVTEMKKNNNTKVMNKVYLGLLILEISKTVMYDFWYHYVKPKHREKAGLCYMDTDRFIVYIKSKAIYLDIAKNVETKFDISNYELGRPLPKSKNKRVNGLMKDELGWKK